MSGDTKALARMEGQTDLRQYSPADYNVLAPISTVGRSVEYVQQSAVVVSLDPDPSKGDCYAAPGTRWEKDPKTGEFLPINVAPAKPGLMKLASAMGIVWRVEHIKPRSHHLVGDMAAAVGSAGLKDLFEQVRYDVAYRAQVAVRDGLGWRFLEASYEWELEAQTRKVKRDARKAQRKAEEKKKPFDFDRYVDERLDQIISDRHALAESKAILRAIRATGIRQQYTRDEFGKPFVVQRVDLRLDTEDPAVRKAIAEKAVQSGSDIFGGAPSPSGSPAALPSHASAVPDFEAAERSGGIERVTPGDDDAVRPELVGDADESGPRDDAIGSAFDGGDKAEPKEAPAQPTLDEAKAECEQLWSAAKRAHKAGQIEEMPPHPKQDGTVEELLEWCKQCSGFLGALAGVT